MNRTVYRVARTRPPAKLNVFLELCGKRADGYHELDTVMIPIDWCDELTVRRRDQPGTRLRVDWSPSAAVIASRLGIVGEDRERLLGIPNDQRNLVVQALNHFGDRFGIASGFDVTLRKQIPAGAGLGGASSDAAAALTCAAQLHELAGFPDELSSIGAKIGSDVPFFLGLGGTRCAAMRARGRGERLQPVAVGTQLHFVVVYPAESLSTASIYAQSRLPDQPVSADNMIAALALGELRAIANETLNRLMEPARKKTQRIDQILKRLWQCDLIGCQLTGSGSACFGIAETAVIASQAAETLRARLEPGALVTAAKAIQVPSRVELR